LEAQGKANTAEYEKAVAENEAKLKEQHAAIVAGHKELDARWDALKKAEEEYATRAAELQTRADEVTALIKKAPSAEELKAY
jgi:uncharacterized protein (DUF3084 family)